MREILFRGKRVRDNRWAYGSLLKVTIDHKSAYMIFGDDFIFAGDGVRALNHAMVEPATVGQFTGLTDKNGKRIFEGDILQNEEGCLFGASYRFRVEFYPGRFYGESGGLLTIVAGEMHLCEVIGNIHDNPELMEVRECR